MLLTYADSKCWFCPIVNRNILGSQEGSVHCNGTFAIFIYYLYLPFGSFLL